MPLKSENGAQSPVAMGTGADVVYMRLREAILSGELAPGRAISQTRLAGELGVSRTPLREAVRSLRREGLVDGEANSMVRVAPVSIQDVEELFAVRIANEALGVQLTVPSMTAETDAELKQAMREMSALAAAGEFEAWQQPHRRFHACLVAGGGQRLCTMLSELYDYSERYRRVFQRNEPQSWSVGAGEHEAIAQACHARDAAGAAAELARHLSRTALFLLMQIAPEHEPVVVRAALRAVLGSEEIARRSSSGGSSLST